VRLRVQVVEPGHHRHRLEALTGLDVQENQARRMLNDLEHHRAVWSAAEKRRIADREAAGRWLGQVYRPAVDSIPSTLRGKLDDAETFHQLLEHRWYLSERERRDVPMEEVTVAYARDVLASLPESPGRQAAAARQR
jgi:hypothetical protein